MKETLLSLFALISCMAWGQLKVDTINIMNPAVQAYLADNTYNSTNDYQISVVNKYYNPDTRSVRQDWPQGKVVNWKPTVKVDSIAEIRITVSESSDYSNPCVYHPKNNKVSTYTIANSLPQKTYFYKVEEIQKNGKTTETANGAFHTFGQIRMIRVDGARNVRDLGGWPSTLGGHIRYGVLYRSGKLDKVTPIGVEDFAGNLHVGAELDMRGESKITASPLGQKVDFVNIKSSSYIGALRGKLQPALIEDIRWIIARMKEGKCVDWHCAVGCDRCGTLTLVIEGLLGVNETDLCRDYELSTFAHQPRFRSHKDFQKLIPYIKKFGPETNLAQCFYNYLAENGMEREELDYLREKMIER